jgi:hypothetical protein
MLRQQHRGERAMEGTEVVGTEATEAAPGFWEYPIVQELTLLVDHWVYLAVLAILVLGMIGKVGKGVGLYNLFRDDDQIFGPASKHDVRPPPEAEGLGLRLVAASPAFWTAFGLALSTGLLWTLMHTGARCAAPGAAATPCPLNLFPAEAGEADVWPIIALGLVLLLTGLLSRWVAATQLDYPRSDGTVLGDERRQKEMRRVTVGAALGAIAILATVQVTRLLLGTLGANPDHALAWLLGSPRTYTTLAAVYFLVEVWRRPNALPALSIFSLLIAAILVGTFLASLAGFLDELVILGLGGWIVYANGRYGKARLPGIEPLYDAPINPQSRDPDAPPPVNAALIDPLEPLAAWRARQPRKPILVLLATSGGAYRAAFWTSLLMDKLVAEAPRRWQGLDDNVRLVTGASGGMVAGAYFAVMAGEGRLDEGVTQRISRDTHTALSEKCRRRQPIARDSLSPVVHQLTRGDLWQVLTPEPSGRDRGRVLDAQWLSLQKPYAEHLAAERAGRMPSLVLSPMLVETGAVAIFSNLDLTAIRCRGADASDGLNVSSVEIFHVFPQAHTEMPMATAVRLNATFPYISPAISLPTLPERRVVDAGYYDNYGIDLATGFLDEPGIEKWVRENCSGVAIIEARAFPSETMTPPAGRLKRAFGFLTSPPEALFSARQSSQMFRNNQQLVATARRYATCTSPEDAPVPVRAFTFENVSRVSMSWYVRSDEIAALARLLDPPTAEEIAEAEAARAYERGEKLTRDLQREKVRGPARDVQAILRRAELAREFDALEAFWADPAGPDPRAAAADDAQACPPEPAPAPARQPESV